MVDYDIGGWRGDEIPERDLVALEHTRKSASTFLTIPSLPPPPPPPGSLFQL